MTLAKTCHASNTMQDLEKATYRPVATICFLNRDFSMFNCCNMKKLSLVLKLKVAMFRDHLG